MDQLRALVEAADRQKVELLNQLEEEKRWSIIQSSYEDLIKTPHYINYNFGAFSICFHTDGLRANRHNIHL